MTFEIIWICYDRARNMPYTIWKTKTRWTKCNSRHKMKLSLFTGRIGRPEGRNIFKSQPTHDEFCHKKNTLWLLRFFWYVVGNHLGPMHNKSLRTGRSRKCRNLRSNTKVNFFCDRLFFSWMKWSPIISQQNKPKLQNVLQKAPCSLNEMSYDVWDQCSLHI